MSSVVVIGGGPAGMMAAIKAAEEGNTVTLIEKNEKLGKKLYITGKGRCNVTNNKDISEFFDNIPGNPSFLYSSLYSYTNLDVMNFFQSEGVELKVERGDRVFPKSDKSSDIIKAFEKKLKRNNVKILLNTVVEDIEYGDKTVKSVILAGGKKIKGDNYIIATGGISYPQTGSTGDGYNFAKKAGHTIINPRAALTSITVEEQWIKELSGLSLKNVELSLKNNNKVIYKDFGEMLFTHFGISGPIALTGSRLVHDFDQLKACINLKPALDRNSLDKRIQKDFVKYANKDFKNSLSDLLPKKIIDVVIRLSNIDENKKVNSITKNERNNIIDIIQNFTLNVSGVRPIAEAIITAGGISTKEIDPSTMQSKLVNNLYFAGEVIDVDANTGGFNLQIAYSTGVLAGSNIEKR